MKVLNKLSASKYSVFFTIQIFQRQPDKFLTVKITPDTILITKYV